MPSDGCTSTCWRSRTARYLVSPPGHRPPPWPRRSSTSAIRTRHHSRTQAFLALLHKVPSEFSSDTDQTLVADGQLACAGLAHEKSADEVINSLTARGLDLFEASLVGISATEYFCQQDGLQALKDVQQELAQGSG